MAGFRHLIRRERKLGIQLPRWLDRATSIGIISHDPQVVRRQRVTNVAAFATVGNTISHLIINSIHNFEGLLAIHIYNVAMMIAALLIPFLHRFGQHTAAIALLIL